MAAGDGDWPSTVTAATAIYAAVVATGALALEVRRWFESGPRLSLGLIPEGEAVGGIVKDPNTYLVARITNRGNLPTTVTNFALHEYPSIFHRLTHKPSWSAIVTMPQPISAPLPHVLTPGTEWTGSTTYHEELRDRARKGSLFVAIYHSHCAKPVQAKVILAKLSTTSNE